ncbi:hypothetical protein [Kamptonema sp. UHCC 0994]|uniref:hypothetical protein n=1 Tax=Kamptonema sp. UHCC 0994 TaxID=3031329 RepID=UPI0023B92EF9|nr:hypothetical protein [Kamptonema sp. UHCC 0994]MDF0553187.1 hypothetical protein [Kamptonema sp. UHCC 0994]
MNQSQVISFRASGQFLSWIETQRLEGESPSQAAQRILREISGTSTVMSTSNNTDIASTEMSTSVDKIVSDRVDPILERLGGIEERLGKLRA